MRCFIAVDVSSEVKEELRKVEKELSNLDSGTRLKLVNPENLHITIRFLGDLTDTQINKVKEALKKVKFEPFKVKLNNFGVFPSINFIRVVWVNVLPKEQLIELEKEIDKVLGDVGFKRTKDFETHITLARVKYIKDKKDFIEGLNKIVIKPIEFKIDGFSLKKSTLTREGPVYEDIFILKNS